MANKGSKGDSKLKLKNFFLTVHLSFDLRNIQILLTFDGNILWNAHLNCWGHFAIFLYFGDPAFEKKAIVTTSKKKKCLAPK